MHLIFEGVNDAYGYFVDKFYNGTIPGSTTISPSRDGEVTTIEEPVLVTYRDPTDRVLLDSTRDCNPFFHLFEALWMLSGSDDLKPLLFFNSKMERFSDNGENLNGAYGYRWRHGGGRELIDALAYRPDAYSSDGKFVPYAVDQIEHATDYLRREPFGRRAVIQMWNPWDDLMHIDGEPGMSRTYSKDVCCNTNIYFRIAEGPTSNELDMTVCNRSNDAILGMLGANYVHMSILQEYLAALIGVGVGCYHQFTNNLHVYNKRTDLEKLYKSPGLGKSIPYPSGNNHRVPLLSEDETVGEFDKCVNAVVSYFRSDSPGGDPIGITDVTDHGIEGTEFFRDVVVPMMVGFCYHKNREYIRAYYWIGLVRDTYWRYVAYNWISKREQDWKLRKEERRKEKME